MPRVHRKVHCEMQATKTSGSTRWQAVASWEANEEAMTFAPATFEIQTQHAHGDDLDEQYCYICAELYINKALG